MRSAPPASHDHDHDHDHDEDHGHDDATGDDAWIAPEPLAHGAGAGKVLHLDAFAGIAGDMFVAAMLDLGVPLAAVTGALDALDVHGYELAVTARTDHGIVATRFHVNLTAPQPPRDHRAIRALLESAPLPPGVRDRALRTFAVLARAEARVHRMNPDDVHFHEVGGVDAIVDIVSASAALDWLGARVNAGPLPVSRGFVRAAHGILPIPAPAVLEVLAGVPTVHAPLDGEMVTPTGASLVRAQASTFSPWPAMAPVRTGFGAGTRRWHDRPNLLRVVLGEPVAETIAPTAEAPFAELRCNLDDLTPELVAVLTERLLAEGCLDVWTTAIGMKKGRPGVQVSALVRSVDRAAVTAVLLAESGSLGVRWTPVHRTERARISVTVATPFGPVPVKVAEGDGLPAHGHPELEACRAAATLHGVPVRVVVAAALAAWTTSVG